MAGGNESLSVFVVDDDPAMRMMAAFQLQGINAEVHEFGDGNACLEAASDAAPDVILLDVEMPGLDGVSVCSRLRESGNAETQVIFVSSHDDLDTRLTAYDAGGNDYIVKPCSPEELLRKVRIAGQARQSFLTVRAHAQIAQQAAFTAMTSMAEMGVTQEFLRASFSCVSLDELGHAICAALEQYGVTSMVELRDEQQQRCFSTQGTCSELEVDILGHTRHLERIFQFRDRLAINYPRVTLLSTGLPLSDPDRVGRLRDHLAVLAQGAQARIEAMITEGKRAAQSAQILHAVARLTKVLEEIEQSQSKLRAEALAIADEQMVSVTRAFVSLGLTDPQEDALMALIKQGIDRTVELQNNSESLSQQLHEVTTRLREMVSECGQA